MSVSKKITKSPFCLFLLIYTGHDRTSREVFFTSPLRRLFTVSTKCRPWGNFEIRARTEYVVSKAVCLFALLFAEKGIDDRFQMNRGVIDMILLSDKLRPIRTHPVVRTQEEALGASSNIIKLIERPLRS
jgi:hypothetical protein